MVRPNVFARKDSGSYYTPDDLVDLIVRETVGPLADSRIKAFAAKAEDIPSSQVPEDRRMGRLKQLDPAEKLLELKVCDPAMGSGHFLVNLVDYLADRVIEAMAEAEALVDGYLSPLVERIDGIRNTIMANAEGRGWTFDPAQLDDRHIIRRSTPSLSGRRSAFWIITCAAATACSAPGWRPPSTGGWVTLQDVYRSTVDAELFAEKIREARDLVAEACPARVVISHDDMIGHAEALNDWVWIYASDEDRVTCRLDPVLRDRLAELKIPFETEEAEGGVLLVPSPVYFVLSIVAWARNARPQVESLFSIPSSGGPSWAGSQP